LEALKALITHVLMEGNSDDDESEAAK
jgi:hypothetical protein